MVIGCKDVHKAYGVNVILDKITFNIEDKEKAAVVGVNGAGKTTLFQILAGKLSLDAGELFFKKESVFGYLEQNQQIKGKGTIYEEMLHVFDYLRDTETKLREMENIMGSLQGQELSDNMEKYSALQHFFEQNDGYGYESRIRGVLKGLGFTEDDAKQPISQLSGGQKTRVYLGRLLLSKPDVLFLDEPTNHLDMDSIQWLEDFLKNYNGAVLIISHDRYFLDRIVTKVIEIENKKSSVYMGNYSFYANQKEVNRQIMEKAYSVQQKEIKRQEDIIRTLRSFNREKSVKRAESREKNLGKMERLEAPEHLPEKMRLTLTPQVLSGMDVLYGEGISKSFDGQMLFQNICLNVKREDKIAIIGPNGVGKSTLFKILLGKLRPDTGEIRLGMNVKVGYYDQEQQNLCETKTIFQEIADTYPTMESGKIRNILAAFVFTGDDIYKPISALSGGERGRVSLAKIMLSNANVLMLDEPTNHLDIYSKEILEDAINRYTGTVIYISHDRYFIDRTAQMVWELSQNGIERFLGNYSYYMEKKAEQAVWASEEAKKAVEQGASSACSISDTKAEWRERKEQQTNKRRIQAQIEKVEEEIAQTEQEVLSISERLFLDHISSDAALAAQLFEQKMELESRLETLYETWECLQVSDEI